QLTPVTQLVRSSSITAPAEGGEGQRDEDGEEPDRADHAELLATLARHRRETRAVGLLVGEDRDAMVRYRQEELGDLESLVLRLVRETPEQRLVAPFDL